MINVELKSLIGKLNGYGKTALEAAAGACISRSNYEVTIEHVLLKLVEDPEHDFQLILGHFGVDAGRVQKSIQRAVEREKTGNQGKPVFSPLLIEWMQDAWMLASVDFGLGQIRSGAFIAALVLNPRRYGLADYYDELSAVGADDLRLHFKDVVGGSKEDAEARLSAAGGAPGAPVGAPSGNTALEKYTVNFTARARAGEIDPVFCRDREIRQAIDILGRRRKNNPIFVGEAGVGKTAVVEGLALKIVEGDVPDILKNVEIFGLDMGLLQAGASVKGEFEQRLKSVIQEVKASPKPIIIFIDEAHTLIGAGGSAGGGDAANLLKPALARGEMRTLAATTWSEYKKYFEKDPALARRFQLVKIEEPSADEAVVIMRGLREKYETSHNVYVRDDAVVATAQLAARYISGRQLPDKSVDLLDTACARVKINISSKPERIDELERRVKTLERELGAISRDIETGIRADNGSTTELQQKIAALNQDCATLEVRWKKEKEWVDRILDLRSKIAAATAVKAPTASAEVGAQKKELAEAERHLAEIQGKDPLLHFEVNPDAVSKVVADWTGIPVGNMVKDELASIMSFGANMKKRIKGQDHAIDALERRIRSSKAGLSSQHAPIGVFLLVGPSGVGKTETGLGIADMLFGGERFVVTINMSEYQEKHTVSRLIGSPPGYVGYGEGGQLTEAVRQRPYAVVLLDEVEKADPEVLNLFYQVFDKGSLTDGEGREIDFKNTVILLTSNLGTDIITELSAGDPRPDVDTIAEAVRPVLINHFKPALLARMEVIPYFTISKDAMADIVRLKLNALGKRIHTSQRIQFEYGDEVVTQIVQRCTEVETGARRSRRQPVRAGVPRYRSALTDPSLHPIPPGPRMEGIGHVAHHREGPTMRKSIAVAVAASFMLPLTVMGQGMMEVPEAVRVPAGHTAAMTAVGVGELTYECKAKAADAMAFEWTFAGPMAKLMDAKTQKEVGKYYGGPTWESMDGSKVTGKQVAVAPGMAGSIPLQLVKAEPAMGAGSMMGVTYIQRVNTRGGVAPSEPCTAAMAGTKRTVPYQADYVFYKS